MYQRVILVPRPDYASRVILWRSMILKNEGQITDAFDLSSLAKITDGYTPGQMHTVATTVLNERRIQQVIIIVCVCLAPPLKWLSILAS